MLATVPAAGGVTGGGGLDVRVVPDLDEVVSALDSASVRPPRRSTSRSAWPQADRGTATARRAACSGHGAASVFPAPVRAVLDATSYAHACAVSREHCGKAVSKQLYNILGKIRAVDDVVSPRLQAQLFEACPELSFALMNDGAPMRHTKRTQEGRAERVAVLRVGLEVDVTPLVDRPPSGAARDDVLDALALAWTARRCLAGTCLRLGGDVDDRGLRMQVVA